MKQRICQSCGMSMPTDDLLGTHGNGCLQYVFITIEQPKLIRNIRV